MAVEVDYSERNPQIVLISVVYPWTVAQWVEGIKRSSELIQNAAVEYVIFDTTHSRSLPSGFLSSLQMIRNYYVQKVKKRVIVGTNGFVKAMLKILAAVNPSWQRTFAFASTLEEAYMLIEKWKATA
jgi:hypothetical protein